MTKPLIKINVRSIEKKLRRHLMQRMTDVVVMLDAYVKNSMKISNLGGSNPSSPGDVPNIGTAALRRSITHSVGTDGKDIIGLYGVGRGQASKYARRLELGYTWVTSTGKNAHQAPRPYIAPAVRNNRRSIKKILIR